jgi:hypothetical protein
MVFLVHLRLSEVVATGKLPFSWPVYRISVAETCCRRRDLAFSGGPDYNANTRRSPWTQTTNCRIPDILFHCPRHDELQVFALETKRARTHLGNVVNQERIVDDMVALSEYIAGLRYLHGFFVGLGFDMDCLRGIFNSIQARRLEQIRSAAGRITVFAIEDGDLGGNFRRSYSRFPLPDLLPDSP